MKKGDILVTGAALTAAYILGTTAFSPGIRWELRRRSGDMSELSWNARRPLECSHFDHDKRRRYYNSPTNGLLVTDIEHLAYHLYFREEPEHIGLDRKQNDWSIRQLKNRAIDFSRREGTILDLRHDVEVAKGMWDTYFEEHPTVYNQLLAG